MTNQQQFIYMHILDIREAGYLAFYNEAGFTVEWLVCCLNVKQFICDFFFVNKKLMD